ncbi:hypothetical protein C1M53_26650 [Mesorhizobium sp. Pch-S]|nr:hypothetical protein C1M53_26650 [Mesorhizobium sp. Pch-S]
MKTPRKRPSATGLPIMVRLQPELMVPLEDAARDLKEESRPEVIRRILRDWLISHGYLKAGE